MWYHSALTDYDPAAIPAHMNPAAWDIIREFASSDSIALPEVESRLKSLLGLGYMEQDWRHAIDAVFAAEHDTESAIQEVEKLATAAANTSRLTIRIQRPVASKSHLKLSKSKRILSK